ncbi:Galactose oxidase/kelch repeat superfamily protein [Rhynchospora pubera]|uniref:Galactose oxidase/kelch repeat superfamily protein n=1 Tax=Rhynchospora pubera TaxID=906938 RepID=A0AAV8F0W1_9POAL|nr:Galactose oxidase/kelch repeat superfamily protein [Rhynchospora pubera]
MGEQQLKSNSDLSTLLSTMPHDRWILVNPSSSFRPSARYKHSAEVVGDKLIVIGGSRNGRYLSDIQVFDLRSFKWSTVQLTMNPKHLESDGSISGQVFPASAGHSLVRWENKLLVVAGNSKMPSDTVRVYQIDLETCTWSPVNTDGEVPISRGGQSVTVVGSRLYMFGGEDKKSRLLNDFHVLDLETMTWEVAETRGTAPGPRFDHIATVHAEQYLLIFGGSSHSVCFSDLHLLDLETMEWSQPETQGAYVTPRGGHAGTAVDDNWYIVGGGDNKSGATETVVLNTSKFVWSVATAVVERHPLASEGLTLCSTTTNGEKLVIAFGGYNGNYNNEIFVMKPKQKDMVRPRLLQSPAAAAAAASVTAAYAIAAASDEKTVRASATEDLKTKNVQSDSTAIKKKTTSEIDVLREEKTNLESKLAEIKAENSRLTDKLEYARSAHSELMKEHDSVHSQLAAESSRCTKLETQIQTAQEKLGAIGSLEEEIETLRREISQIERKVPTAAQQQRSGGVWKWVAGSPQDSDDK